MPLSLLPVTGQKDDTYLPLDGMVNIVITFILCHSVVISRYKRQKEEERIRHI